MLHVDVKKLGNIPDDGGWRYVGNQQGRKNRAATPGKPRNAHYDNKIGTAFVHTVLDNHSRVAYAEIHDDEAGATASAVLRRAVAWFADRGITTIERVLSDNGACYRSNLWRDTCTELGITPKKTRPYRPQTNGKSNDSTAPSPTAGPSNSSTPRNKTAATHYLPGSTTTTTTDPTPPSAKSHPSPA